MHERRRFLRAHVDITLTPAPEGRERQIADLSIGGALVRTGEPLPDGSLMDLNFKLPGEDRTISLTAKVLRTIRENGKSAMAVRFEKIRLEDQIVLGAFVTERAWSEELPEAQTLDEESAEPPADAVEHPAEALAEDVAHESQEWAREGFVVVDQKGKKLTRELAEELGAGVIVVETKK